MTISAPTAKGKVMGMREKLIELLSHFDEHCVTELCCEKCTHKDNDDCEVNARADFLIANGVTVQRWIPVSERLPESEKIVLVSAKSKTFGYRHTIMVAHIGYHEITTEEYGWHEYEGDTEYDEEKDCFWIPECWYEVNSVEDNGNWIIDDDYDVTHWMPLPDPPKGE